MKNGKPVSLEQRLLRLEADVDELKATLRAQQEPKKPWWEEMVGVFANDPVFEEVDRIVQENREKERKRARRKQPKAKAKS